MSFKYKNSILGGPFARFHVGHKRLIDKAFEKSEKVTIGVSTSNLLRNKFLSDRIEDYAVRENSVKEYLKKKHFLPRSLLIPLDDVYGSCLTEKNIQAIFVTRTTLSNAKLINAKRNKIGFPSLEIVVIPLLLGDGKKTITSERIRSGEINRDGNSYLEVFKNKKNLLLPENLREELRKPMGIVVKSKEEIKKNLIKSNLIISVGDIVSLLLMEAGFWPDISLVDFKTRREPIDKSQMSKLFSKKALLCENKPGTINKKALEVFHQALKKHLKSHEKQVMIVKGEEDLLALPAILLSPLSSIVVYGQYDLGTIIVEVTEEKKKQIEEIIKKFN